MVCCGILAAVPLPSSGAILVRDQATLTPDGKFSDPLHLPSGSSASGVDPDGFAFRHDAFAATINSSATIETDRGGGTRTLVSNHTLTADQRQRFQTSDSGFRFDATTAINAGVNSRLSLTTYGNFFFVVTDKHTNKLEINRAIQFVLDQPMQLVIRLSGETSSSDFKSIFNNFQLVGGQLRPLVDRVHMFGQTAYAANETTVFDGSGSRMGVDFTMDGVADAAGIHLVMNLAPTIPGTAQTLQLSWLLRSDIAAEVGPSSRSWNREVSAFGSVEEMVELRPIPEPSTMPLLLIAAALGFGRRRRTVIR